MRTGKSKVLSRESKVGSRGQTLVIAIMVMFILAMVGAIFIAMVARNLFRSERYSNVDVVAQIAEAGIRYADQMLTSSEDGADWRPVPDNMGVKNIPIYPSVLPDPEDGSTPNVPSWQVQREKNPDFQWTRAWWPEERGCAGPTGGYTKFDSGQGRFLLRVSYNPNPNDPFSKYIKIESIGRLGTVDNNDPTTQRPHGFPQLRREITAFKPIGITDYMRFITNKDNRPVDFALGCPGFGLRAGRQVDPSDTLREEWYRGGPIRVNGNLVWYGDNVRLCLRGTDPGPGATAGTLDASTFVPLDTIEVSGDIRIDRFTPSAATSPVRIQVMDQAGNSIGGDDDLWPSDDSRYTSYVGLYRDGSGDTDAQGHPRGIKRIEAPLIDRQDPTNSVPRYQLLTLYSGERVQVATGGRARWTNTGEWGWGRGIYIGNTRDRQDEIGTLIGGFTLRTDWLNPGLFMGMRASGWVGPYYIPLGVVITLHPTDTDGDDQPDITISRSDTSSSGRAFVWRDAWGNERPEWGGTVTMPYPDSSIDPATGSVRGRVIHYRDAYGNMNDSPPHTPRTVDGNGVIYAEGNIRIRGMLPPGMQLTVVSNETIYIEGNLLKYHDPNVPYDDANRLDPWRGAKNTCGLALLARENICVNTTQFFSPLNSISPETVESDAKGSRQPPFHAIVNSSPDSMFRCAFDFGPWESEVASLTAAPDAWVLYLRHAGQDDPSYINAWLNPSSGATNYGILGLNRIESPPVARNVFPTYVWGIGDSRFNVAGLGIGSSFICDAFPLVTAINAVMNTNFSTTAGIMNLLQIGLDQHTYTRSNYLMGGLVVQPMDIRIEAVLYAQEGSFFVIPGTWFNPNPDDSRAAFASGDPRPASVQDPRFPFFGEPLDVRIIIDGAISENVPAPVNDVNEWMSKWGNIPLTYGATNAGTAHPGEGFTILYDDHAGWPLSDLRATNSTMTPIRTDKYGRALPIAPRLPTSSSLIYFGDVM